MPVPLPPHSPPKQQPAQDAAQPAQPAQQEPQEAQQQQQQGPKLTPAEFQAWLQSKGAAPEQAAAAAAEREAAIKAGRVPLEQLTGRELHAHHPEVFEGF